MLRALRWVLHGVAALLAGLAIYGAIVGADDDLCWGVFLASLVVWGVAWLAGRIAEARDPFGRRPTRA